MKQNITIQILVKQDNTPAIAVQFVDIDEKLLLTTDAAKQLGMLLIEHAATAEWFAKFRANEHISLDKLERIIESSDDAGRYGRATGMDGRAIDQ